MLGARIIPVSLLVGLLAVYCLSEANEAGSITVHKRECS